MRVSLYSMLGALLVLGFTVKGQQPAPATPAPASPAPTPAPAAAPAKAETPAATPAATPVAPAGKAEAVPAEPVDPNAPGEWEYRDADLQTVLSSLASRAAVNLIIGDGISGRVTVLLRDVTARQAFEVIAESKGLVVREENKIVKVLTRDAAEMLPTSTRVHTLSYAKAAEIAAILQPNMSKQGRVTVDARSNSLVLTDTQPSLERIAGLLASLDTQTPQVQIEAKFIETSRATGKGMGLDWSGTLSEHEFSVGKFDFMKDLGGGNWVNPIITVDAGSASAVLRFLLSDTDTDLIANPRIVTMDNVKARIAIAEQQPIPQIEFNETTGSYQSKGFEWKDIGIILNVTPRINKEGYITMEVSPEVSSPKSVSKIADIDVPTISTRTASTVVLIKSGNTLIIGGLMQEDVVDVYTKVPVAGDIPGLGALFRSKKLSKTKRDLLVFLTPSLVSPEMRVDEKTATAPMYREVYTNDSWKDNAKPRPWWGPKASREGKSR